MIVTGLTSVPNRTSNKVKSPSIVSQETCETLVIHNSIRQEILQK